MISSELRKTGEDVSNLIFRRNVVKKYLHAEDVGLRST
jgi:hypothetical protein